MDETVGSACALLDLLFGCGCPGWVIVSAKQIRCSYIQTIQRRHASGE
jgi:hypothetical protein